MTDLNAKRGKMKNGHRAWLKGDGIPWGFVMDLGKAWEEIIKDPNSTAVVDAVSKYHNVGVSNNRDVCKDLKQFFAHSTLNPLDLDNGLWSWFISFLIAFRVGRAHLKGEPPPSTEDIHGLTKVGTVHSHNNYAQYNAWDQGSQTFSFSVPLASKLMLTDVGHAKWSDLRTPFPAFVIQVPPELATLKDPSTGLHYMDGVVVVDGFSEGRRRIEMLFTGQENGNSSQLGDDAVVYANMRCTHDDQTLEDALEKSGERVPEELRDAVNLGGFGQIEGTRKLVLWVLAMIFYLTDFPEDRVKVSPDTKELEEKVAVARGKAKRNAKAKLRTAQREPSPFLVGTNVTLDARLVDAAGATGKGQGNSPSVASYVRGHRKLQPHGPERSLRKPIWVSPYWRNLEAGAKTSKTYSVK